MMNSIKKTAQTVKQISLKINWIQTETAEIVEFTSFQNYFKCKEKPDETVKLIKEASKLFTTMAKIIKLKKNQIK